ncbi:hypothetical protein PAXRUDRAFT_161426 [Paxillus rubicundulus Ve08.2h10]|uniref:Alpha-type protein kinase domain-containing protein n=1 Tax=Paxillus rubicundulus Ve08.2h10 TaxID=930991 RepID=A0A0D0C908_9AGAM|nr:hypothetical protein PAXRUDRAFT_161426 [Paxillus rubicundulus Ve08.2h10]
MINSDLYVAKQFFDVGIPGIVTATDNGKYLKADLIRLRLGSWFLSRFHELAKQRGVNIFPVIKFSGTMQHPIANDKHGITVAAFAHFVYEFSKHKMVFADIQGSPMTVNGGDGVILFDVMTHSPEGDSRIGDHGKEGIATFIQQHKCDYICTGLGLLPLEEDSEIKDEVE